MPELILEVLENIVAEFGCSRKKCHPKMKEIIKNSADLSKFMLSGKMPLNATLKYFSRADSIALWDEYFVVIVKVFSVDRYIFNKHCFLYNFILIKPLLNAISQSKGVLEIHESLQNSENNIVLEELLERVLDIPKGSIFPAIKELNIFSMDLNTVTGKDLTHISLKITESFPNLEKLYFVFNLVYENDVLNAMAAIQSKAFEAIPTHIRGIFHFETDCEVDDFKDMTAHLRSDPYVKINPDEKQITKTLLIHDGLFVIFKINFC